MSEEVVVLDIRREVRQAVERFLNAKVGEKEGGHNLLPLDIPVVYIRAAWEHFSSYSFDKTLEMICPMVPFYDAYRCVAYSLPKLAYIFTAGIDVEPTNETIYVAEGADKSNEYGGNPRIMMWLDRHFLQRTSQILPTTATEEERSALLADYPFCDRDENGRYHFSRIEDERRRFSPYEEAYARWIPGDARKALKALFILDNATSDAFSQEDFEKRRDAILSGKVESIGYGL